ncbi:MAG TPA: ABC transporter substrate-binding protein [Anaerolineaceae bacterium]|nr:ABC transporter substrate-binding protein [Anaerolineaceae bacterium]
MRTKLNISIFTSILATASLILGSCTSQKTEPVTLKFAALSILDSLPMYVAEQQGYFAAHGVKVEMIPVSSAPERDQLVAAGQADGEINEVLSTILFDQEKTQIQVVRFARAAAPNSPLFRILSSPSSGITTVEGLKGAQIGISDATVIDYLTDRLLAAEGFSANEIQTISVPKIPDRLALLNSGQLKAGVLPDPMASLAMKQGAVNVLDDTRHPEYSCSTIAFRKEVIDKHPEAVRGFLAAIEEAVTEINKDPNRWKTLLGEKKIIPAPIMDSFQVPTFVTAGVPSESQYADVLAWARENGLVKKEVPYSVTVTASYLPKK